MLQIQRNNEQAQQRIGHPNTYQHITLLNHFGMVLQQDSCSTAMAHQPTPAVFLSMLIAP
jgi:hypothetical protein